MWYKNPRQIDGLGTYIMEMAMRLRFNAEALAKKLDLTQGDLMKELRELKSPPIDEGRLLGFAKSGGDDERSAALSLLVWNHCEVVQEGG